MTNVLADEAEFVARVRRVDSEREAEMKNDLTRYRDEVDAQRRGSVRDHRVARARRAPLDKVEVEQDVRSRCRGGGGGVVLRMQVDEASALSLGARAQCGGLTRRWAEREARDLQRNAYSSLFACLPFYLCSLFCLFA